MTPAERELWKAREILATWGGAPEVAAEVIVRYGDAREAEGRRAVLLTMKQGGQK